LEFLSVIFLLSPITHSYFTEEKQDTTTSNNMGAADHHIQLKPSHRDHGCRMERSVATKNNKFEGLPSPTNCASPSKHSKFIRTALNIVDSNNGNEAQSEVKGEDNWFTSAFDASRSTGKQPDNWRFKSFIDVSSTEEETIEDFSAEFSSKESAAAKVENVMSPNIFGIKVLVVPQEKGNVALLSPKSPRSVHKNRAQLQRSNSVGGSSRRLGSVCDENSKTPKSPRSGNKRCPEQRSNSVGRPSRGIGSGSEHRRGGRKESRAIESSREQDQIERDRSKSRDGRTSNQQRSQSNGRKACPLRNSGHQQSRSKSRDRSRRRRVPSRSLSDSVPYQCTKKELIRTTSELVSPRCNSSGAGRKKAPPLSHSAGTGKTGETASTKPDLTKSGASPRISSRTIKRQSSATESTASRQLCFTASGGITERSSPLIRATSIGGETASPRPQRPGLTRSNPSASGREIDPSKLDGLLQKLRDPSSRNLMSAIDMENIDDGEDDKAQLPVKGRLMSRFLQPSKRMNTLLED
jgi:hypothetical protein